MKKNKRHNVKAGEFWTINDINTKGHKSLITKNKKDTVEHLPITHSPITRRNKNIKLQENPDKTDSKDSYILAKVQKSHKKYLGKSHLELKITNSTDKSIIRHIKKKK